MALTITVPNDYYGLGDNTSSSSSSESSNGSTGTDTGGFNMGSNFGDFSNYGNSGDGLESSTNMLGDFTNWGGDYTNFGNANFSGGNSFSNPSYGDFSGYGRDESPLERFANNPVVSFLMGLHPVTAGANALMKGPTSTGGFLGGLIGSGAGPIGSFLGRGIGQGVGNMVAGNNVTGSSFMPTAGQTGGFLGSMFGGLAGGPAGSTLGGFLGSRLANGTSGATPGFNPGMSNSGFGTSGGQVYSGDNSLNMGGMINDGLAGLIPSVLATNAAQKATKGQISNLEQLFAPNSAYAQDMRQQLERRDAAAGRRSQYGNREVELQAKLATLAAAQAPQIQKLYDQRNANRNMLINTALRNPGVQKLMTQGMNGLAGLFSSPATPSLGGTTFNPDLENMPNYLDTIPWGDTGGGW